MEHEEVCHNEVVFLFNKYHSTLIAKSDNNRSRIQQILCIKNLV